MTEALALIKTVEGAGGKFKIDGERLGIFPAALAEPVMENLRLHKSEIMGLLQSRPSAQTEARDEFGLGCWLIARCVADAKWRTAIGRLYSSFCEWRKEVELSEATETSFAAMLSEAGFPTMGGFTQSLALEADWLAADQFQHPVSAQTTIMPARRRNAKSAKQEG